MMVQHRDKTDVALALVCGVLREGGATVSPRANDSVPTMGYMVGGAAPPYVIHRTALRPADLVAWLDRTDVPQGAYVGSWIERPAFESDLVYFDVSEHYSDVGAAIGAAQARNELAIWDIANGAEIRVSTWKVA